MKSVNPSGSGSFSLNRKDDTTVGNYSFAEGYDTIASGNYSHAGGHMSVAYGEKSCATGSGTRFSVFITGNANATTYTLYEANNNIKVGQAIEYNETCAIITAYDSTTPSITVSVTLSADALSASTAYIYSHVASGANSSISGYNTLACGDY
jgi:hypothetical protein